MNSLCIKNLSKTYEGKVRALDNISLDIGRGIFGLLGPNGAGKSTLMRCIAGLQQPDEGEISLEGENILKNPIYVRKRLGYLPQEFGVYPRLSTLHLLDHLAILKGITNKKKRSRQIHELLERTNLLEYRNRSVHTFSGGMRQRFGIAQALLGNPALLIVDEPTAGLDPEERNRFLDVLSEVAEERIVILSTHIVEDLRDMCQYVAIIHRGKLLTQDDPDSLINKLKGKIWEKRGTKEELIQFNNSYRILSSRLFRGEYRLHVLSDTIPATGFLPTEPDLEDVYFSYL